jgi:hypothetical protein
MTEPVILTNCGHSFDKKNILSWFREHNTCPTCKKVVPNVTTCLVDNILVKQAIEEYRKEKRDEIKNKKKELLKKKKEAKAKESTIPNESDPYMMIGGELKEEKLLEYTGETSSTSTGDIVAATTTASLAASTSGTMTKMEADNTCWYWQDSFAWRLYEVEASKMLENALKQGLTNVILPCGKYTVDLQKMQQMNIRTGYCRSVNRYDAQGKDQNVKWEWKDDDNTWKAFEASVNTAIEGIYYLRLGSIQIQPSNGFLYVIDTFKMTQTNYFSRRVRKIRRTISS